MRGRRRDVDAVRLLAVLLQFPFHAGRVFDLDPAYHVKNGELSAAATVFTSFVHAWRMPLFFLVAGWSAAVLLDRRGAGGFASHRLRRLLPPLLAGVVLLCPAIKWVELSGGIDLRPSGLRTAAPPADALAFLGHFFTRLNQFTWSHLWFLAYLLLLSLLLLPAFRGIARLPRWTSPSRVWAYAPAALLAGLEVLLRPVWGDHPNLYGDWANIAVFALALLAGAALAAQPRLEAMVHGEWTRLALLGVAAHAVAVALPAGPASVALRGVTAWGCAAGLLGGLRRVRWPRTGWFDAAVAAALPLYVLHHLPLVAIALAVTGLDLGVPAKLVLVVAGSVTVTILVFLALRPFRLARLALGMGGHRPGEVGAAGVVPEVGR